MEVSKESAFTLTHWHLKLDDCLWKWKSRRKDSIERGSSSAESYSNTGWMDIERRYTRWEGRRIRSHRMPIRRHTWAVSVIHTVRTYPISTTAVRHDDGYSTNVPSECVSPDYEWWLIIQTAEDSIVSFDRFLSFHVSTFHQRAEEGRPAILLPFNN